MRLPVRKKTNNLTQNKLKITALCAKNYIKQFVFLSHYCKNEVVCALRLGFIFDVCSQWPTDSHLSGGVRSAFSGIVLSICWLVHKRNIGL